MVDKADIAHMDKDEQIAFLLSALRSSEARAVAAESEYAKAVADMSALASVYDKKLSDLTAQLNDTKREMARLIEQIKLASMRYFGSRSEKVIPEQLSLFNDCEAYAALDAQEPSLEDILPQKRIRRRGGKPAIDYSKFETVIIDHEIEPERRACPECGDELSEMSVEVTRKVRIVPAHLVVEEHRRHVYRCTSCCTDNAQGGESKGVIVRAQKPNDPIPGSFVTPSLIAWLINGKYVNSLPLYRMEAELKSLGANISRQNMANWMTNVHRRWLSKVHARMKAELLSHERMHADETVVQVLKEPGREAKSKSRMWLFCSAACDVPVYIFEYHQSRGKGVAKDFLRTWSGTLATDGYRPYFNLGLPGIVNVACAVHVRRYFAQIVKVAGGDAKAASVVSVALEARRMIDRIFTIDSQFDGMDPNERKKARDAQLREPMERFYAWVKEQLPKASPGLALHKALSYAVEYWPYVMNILDDGHLELSNNIAERAIKPFVIGRKNWLFSDTPAGAHASAAIYSITTTAKANGLNPRLYVEWLLTKMPNAGELTDEVVDSFLPWASCVPDSCRLAPADAAKAKEMTDIPIVDVDPYLENDELENNLKENG